MTKLDVLDALDTLRVCVAYECDGRRYEHMPYHQTVLHNARPRVRGAAGVEGGHLHGHRVASPAGRGQGLCAFPGGSSRRTIKLVGVGPGRSSSSGSPRSGLAGANERVCVVGRWARARPGGGPGPSAGVVVCPVTPAWPPSGSPAWPPGREWSTPICTSSARRSRWSTASPTNLRAAGHLVFGPGPTGPGWKGPKAWMKELLAEAGVPTALRHLCGGRACAGVLRSLPGTVGSQNRRPGRRKRTYASPTTSRPPSLTPRPSFTGRHSARPGAGW